MHFTFSREDTKAIKGIAVILMIIHHLWGFPNRIPGGELTSLIILFGQDSTSYFGSFGKLCVSLFFFLGGYGLYKCYESNSLDLIQHIKKLYISYWKVFVIFVPIGFLFFSNQPIYCANEGICTRFANFSFQALISNFLGFSNSYNSEWWFFQSYIIAILTFPFIVRVIRKFSFSVNMFIIILLTIAVTNVLPALGTIEILGQLEKSKLYDIILCQYAPHITCFWAGILMSKDNSLTHLAQSLSKNRLFSPCHNLLLLGAVVFARTSVFGNQFDIFFTPLFIVCCSNLLHHLQPIRKLFLLFSKHSTNMWLIHSFFCFYFYPFAKLVVAPRYAILSLGVLILLTFTSSVLLTKFWDLLHQLNVKLGLSNRISTWSFTNGD